MGETSQLVSRCPSRSRWEWHGGESRGCPGESSGHIYDGGRETGCQVPKIRCAAEHISFLQGPFLGVLQGCMAILMVVMTIIIPDMHVNSHTFMSSYIF